MTKGNIDPKTVDGFGDEWTAFDQSALDRAELARWFEHYFAVFPWDRLPAGAVGFDLGCGSGRWDLLLAPRVGHLHCVDASDAALEVARRNLSGLANVSFHQASVDAVPLPAGSMDFGVSLGVLHHVPDTAAAIAACAGLLKPGAPLLLYLYYRFDDRPWWFKALWRLSDSLRQGISRLPFGPRRAVTTAIAGLVYWPLARLALILEKGGLPVDGLPLAHYRAVSFYTLRTDALDRFGTRLEQRFTRPEIAAILTAAGLGEIRFSDGPPFWCVSAIKR